MLSAVAFLDRTNISVAGVQIGREFAIPNTRLGWVFSAFLIGYAAFQVPAGLLAGRLGPRRVLTLGVLWWGLFTALTTVVSPRLGSAVMVLALVRFALGAGEAMMYPAASQFVERWFPVQERGRANGIIFAGVGIGSGLTPPLVTAIILRYGWRASFWFSALAGALAGAVWYLAARDIPEQHPLVGEAELLLIEQGRATRETSMEDDPRRGRKRGAPWGVILHSKEVFALTASYFAFGYVAWIYFAWFYIYLAQARGLSLKTSAVYSMLPFIAMTLGCLLGGVASDWIAQHYSLRLGRCLLPAASLTLTAVILRVGSHAGRAETASAILALGAGVLYLSQSCYWAVAADISGERAGVVSGIMNMGAQVGSACTASLTPLIAAHFGWEMSFLAAALLSVLGGLAWIVIDPSQRIAPGSS